MNGLKLNTVLSLLLLFPLALMAQSVDESGLTPNFSKDRTQQFKAVASNNLINTNSTMLSQNQSVFVQQIGQYNRINSTTQSLVSDINYIQNGNRNNIETAVTAVGIEETVIQSGTRNGFFSLSSGDFTHRSAVIQQGSNQNLYMLGSNSISDRMLVNMRGSQQTIIVRNFK